ncbi:MAG TPA: nickel-dependent hydrogenase large subunit, partial [Bacillota bacterium]|nr:nickel-dependent hydrogenase large subunit [Bacillota bacterium]
RCRNPFRGIIVRSVEILYACDEALRILEHLELPGSPAVDLEPCVGTGYGCTEAPRGILYHRYRLDGRGVILDAKIVPPTSQNQKTIEGDLWEFVPTRLELPKEQLQWQCEQAIRNYDPCISCSTHSVKLYLEQQ